MNTEQKGIETLLLNTRFLREDIHHATNMPVYAGAAYEFDTAEEMEAAFLGKSGKHTYSRISNPTVEYFEQRVKAISDARFVTALSSGMAAISNTFFTLGYAGSNIVTSSHLFGNTYSFFRFTLAAFGVEVRFCNLLNMQEVKKNIDENTCAVFTEILTNPHLEIVNLKELAEVTHSFNIPLIVDSTVIPWNQCKAREFGTDIEVVSSTKYISGGATSIGGLILDHGTYDWNFSKRLKSVAEKQGKNAFQVKLRSEIFRNIGACMAPQTAYLQNLGLETLEVRYNKASISCCELAKFLETVPEVKEVNYTGLEKNPYYRISQIQFGNNPGAMLTFSLENKKICYAFMNKLRLIRRSTNLFDNKSLIIHPESTIYGTFTPEEKAKLDIPDNMLRMSVGLEDIEDLKADILQALKAS